MTFRRQNIRLSPQIYRGPRLYFVTLCCEGRGCFFAKHNTASWLITCLRRDADATGFAVHAYCVMPNHLHLLVEGKGAKSSLLTFIKQLKQKTAFEYQQRFGERLWQTKFYDHILRSGDSPDRVAWYIWTNPVRKGISSQPHEYPFSGSFTLEWRTAPQPPEPWIPAWKKKAVPA